IGILTNIPTPYRKAMWEAYSTIEKVTFDVYYCSPIESDRKWQVASASGVSEHYLDGFTLGRSFHLNLSILKFFKRHDLWLIGGYSMPTAQILILLCKFQKIPYVIMFDGISPQKLKAKEKPVLFQWKRFLVRNCLAWLGNGTVGREYAKKLGLSEEKLYNQYLTVDVEHFQRMTTDKEKIRTSFRAKWCIDSSSYVILYVGRLIESKGVQDLLEAYRQICEGETKQIELLIVGHGSYEEVLKQKAKGLTGVHFIGHVEYENIHEAYLASDLLVLPSYDDPWGLVINEAFACNLKSITTTSSGVHLDFHEDANVYKAGDVKKLIELIIDNIYIANQEKIDKTIVSPKWNFEKSKESLISIIRKYHACN
ncbi:MAG: glycosyltransferase family 4 protein, partial [Bacteroidales bacterium]|nr:glycosyltransferase family 4 protein [Bacteroidales bacterium]